MRRSLLRGLTYFAVVFAAGFTLGPIRVLWLVPRVGERSAEIIEAPFMLVAIILTSRFVVRRFPAAAATRERELLGSGALALLLLLAVEFTVVLGLRGVSVAQYFAERDPVAGALYAVMLVLFGLMPWMLGRRGIGDGAARTTARTLPRKPHR